MKAAIYYGPKDVRVDEIADAEITEPHQMLVKASGTSMASASNLAR